MTACDYRENGECWNCGCCDDPSCCADADRCTPLRTADDGGHGREVAEADQ